MTNSELDRQKLITLRKLLITSFDLEELQVLCFDLGVDYEELAGNTKTTKVHDFITHLQRRGSLEVLLDEVTRQRPNVDWPEFQTSNPAIIIGDSYTDDRTGLVMIRIPSGEFVYGQNDEKLGMTERILYLDEFWISKTPITNRLYGRFVTSTGQKPPRHWQGNSPPTAIADHPVIEVSWYDATAYCQWADGQLPTEEQWEKAARGTDGRKYPWGNEWQDDHCNTRETRINGTSAVGHFSPQGDSPYGCVDMVGNMWEWTASLWTEDENGRVVRGGSWGDVQTYALATYRGSPHPVTRAYLSGFRLARRP